MLEVGNSFTFGYEGDNIMGLAEHHHLFNGALNSLKKLARARGRNTLQKTNVSNEANINTIGKGGGRGPRRSPSHGGGTSSQVSLTPIVLQT